MRAAPKSSGSAIVGWNEEPRPLVAQGSGLRTPGWEIKLIAKTPVSKAEGPRGVAADDQNSLVDPADAKRLSPQGMDDARIKSSTPLPVTSASGSRERAVLSPSEAPSERWSPKPLKSLPKKKYGHGVNSTNAKWFDGHAGDVRLDHVQTVSPFNEHIVINNHGQSLSPNKSQASDPVSGIIIPPGALKRRNRLVQRRAEHDNWRLQRNHLKALREGSDLHLPVVSLSKPSRLIPMGEFMGQEAGYQSPDESMETYDSNQEELIDPSVRWRLLTEGFRHADTLRDGTVGNQDFVRLLRMLDLDLGEDATLELLQKYNRHGRSDYVTFLKNIKKLLFPAEGHHAEEVEVHVDIEVEDAPATRNPAMEVIMEHVKEKVSNAWWKWRQKTEGRGSGLKSKPITSLESQLELQRLLQEFQACLSPQEFDYLLVTYRDWCNDLNKEEDPDSTLGLSGRGWTDFLTHFIFQGSDGFDNTFDRSSRTRSSSRNKSEHSHRRAARRSQSVPLLNRKQDPVLPPHSSSLWRETVDDGGLKWHWNSTKKMQALANRREVPQTSSSWRNKLHQQPRLLDPLLR